MNTSLSILIPAAGDSSRLGQAKQLVEFADKPLLQHTIDTALSISPFEVITIIGAQSERIRNAIDARQVKWLVNPDWRKGLGGTIAVGAKSVDPACTGVLVILCDQWRIERSDLLDLVAAWQSEPDAIVTASRDDQTMPPVIFPSDCLEQLAQLSGQRGAQTLLKAQPERVRMVAMKNAAFDLDYPHQLPDLNKKP